MKPAKYHQCSDCKAMAKKGAMYRIRPPQDLSIPISQPRGVFWMCIKCWERLVGAAMVQILR